MFISDLDHAREQAAAVLEMNAALLEQQKRFQAQAQELNDEIWQLRQQVFALQNPEMWARIKANPEQAEILGVTI